MRRITLLAMLALMVAVVMPVMATDFTWSGELTYGFITDGTNVTDAYTNAALSVKGAADANNTFYATLVGGFAGTGAANVVVLGGGITTLAAFTVNESVIYMTSDLGKILGLNGISLMSTIGWLEPAATSYSVTGWGYESLIAYDPWGISHDTFELVAGVGSAFNLQFVSSPIDSTLQTQSIKPQFIVDAYGTLGPINYSIAYTSNKTTDYMGLVGASVKWGQAMGDLTPAVNAEVNYNLATNAATVGIGVQAVYTTLLTVGVGTAINVTPTFGLGNLGINVNLVPATGLGVDVDVSLNMATGAANLINAVDGSVWYMLGKSKLRVGYLYENGAFAFNAPANLTPNGGLYATMDLTF